MITTASTTTTTTNDVLSALDPEGIEAFAALDGVSDDMVSLAVSGMPGGTRTIGIEYDLLTDSGRGDFALTDVGREVVKAAMAQCPQPYADVDLDDLLASTRAAVAELAADAQYEVETPVRYETDESAPAIRRAGVAAARYASHLVHRGTKADV
jgi:hypothetical protein